MWFINRFVEGGWQFMSVLLILEIFVFVFAGKKFYDFFIADRSKIKNLKRGLPEVLQIGQFALFTGILGQCIGLFSAFDAFEEMGEVSQAMLAWGLKVSMISTLYGMAITAMAVIFWFFLNQRYLTLMVDD